ncbi:uncharacterized protein LOC122006603 [Zingiber officinale]|uniref:uncharacterized protein LOC122006603 n=1 Tax=Zingiber officinale TaxID=94328 RepID=UPI001C4C7EC5|nr:uncharacterized protein LOC122006603 [Zingiber officinale]
MNGLGDQKPKIWIENSATGSGTSDKNAAPFRNYGSSMNSLSFGFLATAILISMFLIMAIFEHLFRSRASHTSSPLDDAIRARQEADQTQAKKNKNSQSETSSIAVDFSVLMPGQLYPTYLAQPAPLPCPREGVPWPSHHQPSFDFP